MEEYYKEQDRLVNRPNRDHEVPFDFHAIGEAAMHPALFSYADKGRAAIYEYERQMKIAGYTLVKTGGEQTHGTVD